MRIIDAFYLSKATGRSHSDYVNSYITLVLQDNEKSFGVLYIDDMHLPIIHEVHRKYQRPEIPIETSSIIVFEWQDLKGNSDDALKFFSSVYEQGILVEDHYVFDGDLLVSALDTPISKDLGVLS